MRDAHLRGRARNASDASAPAIAELAVSRAGEPKSADPSRRPALRAVAGRRADRGGIRINPAAKINGVLDDRFGRVAPDDPGAIGLGGPYTVSRWPENSSWDFVAVGRGHDVDYWSEFLQAIERVDADMAVNIEHEDQELGQLEGLRAAAETLLSAAGRARA